MELADATNRLQTLTASSTVPTLSAGDITALLTQYATIDYNGLLPTDPDWVGTWNFNAAAHEGWMIKAGRVSDQFNFSSDVHNFSREQMYKHCIEMADKYVSKKLGTMDLAGTSGWPPVIGNLNDV